jgi:hypothetical protein
VRLKTHIDHYYAPIIVENIKKSTERFGHVASKFPHRIRWNNAGRTQPTWVGGKMNAAALGRTSNVRQRTWLVTRKGTSIKAIQTQTFIVARDFSHMKIITKCDKLPKINPTSLSWFLHAGFPEINLS